MDYGYARVSRLDQNPQLQIDALEAAGCWPIVEEKASGADNKRPVRAEILAQVKPGDTITVWKLDRWGRSTEDLLATIKDLEARSIRFRCLTQPIDTSDAMGKMFLTLLAAFAEFERSLIVERTLAGKARMKAEGLHPGGSPMYGFAADHVTIIEEEAELLREAARRALDGESLAKIADDWTDKGICSRNGARWRVTPLRRNLLNPRVVPIIGQETYDKLVRMFANPGNRRQKMGRPAQYLGSGILRCGREDCGQPMYSGMRAGPTPLRNYVCKRQAGSGGRFTGCGRVTVSQARADDWLREAFIAAVSSPDFADALNRRRAELLAGEVTVAQIEEWRAELDDLELIMPTRFATEIHRQRRDELQRLIRQTTAGLVERPDLQALLDLPKAEAQLREAWEAWSIVERRLWLRRVFEHVNVKPAASTGRGSDVEDRLDPVWKL